MHLCTYEYVHKTNIDIIVELQQNCLDEYIRENNLILSINKFGVEGLVIKKVMQ